MNHYLNLSKPKEICRSLSLVPHSTSCPCLAGGGIDFIIVAQDHAIVESQGIAQEDDTPQKTKPETLSLPKKHSFRRGGNKCVFLFEMMMIRNSARCLFKFLVMISDVVLLEFNGSSG